MITVKTRFDEFSISNKFESIIAIFILNNFVEMDNNDGHERTRGKIFDFC